MQQCYWIEPVAALIQVLCHYDAFGSFYNHIKILLYDLISLLCKTRILFDYKNRIVRCYCIYDTCKVKAIVKKPDNQTVLL